MNGLVRATRLWSGTNVASRGQSGNERVCSRNSLFRAKRLALASQGRVIGWC